jgi:hypothetical protein
MGRLRDLLQKQAKKKKNGTYGGSYHSLEMTYVSDLILYQSQDELYLAKSRYGNNGFVKLSQVLELIIQLYLNSNLKEELTPVAFFNEPIKEDLEKAMKGVLIKHGLIKE